MANEENLSPAWEKGQSGNPAGRPVGSKNRSTILREILEMVNKESGLTKEYHINDALANKALSGDVAAYKEIMDTVYGKTPDVNKIGNIDGETLKTQSIPDSSQFLAGVAGVGEDTSQSSSSED